jgi:hypothetical protein
MHGTANENDHGTLWKDAKKWAEVEQISIVALEE